MRPFVCFRFWATCSNHLTSQCIPPATTNHIYGSNPTPQENFQRYTRGNLQPFAAGPLARMCLQPQPFLYPRFQQQRHCKPHSTRHFKRHRITPTLHPSPLTNVTTRQLTQRTSLRNTSTNNSQAHKRNIKRLRRRQDTKQSTP